MALLHTSLHPRNRGDENQAPITSSGSCKFHFVVSKKQLTEKTKDMARESSGPMSKRGQFMVRKIAVMLVFVVTLIPIAGMLLIHPVVSCYVDNIGKENVAASLVANIRKVGPGTLDASALSERFGRVCAVEYLESGQYALPRVIYRENLRKKGRDVCQNWNSNLAVFALISSQSPAHYVLGHWQFDSVPGGTSTTSRQYCGSVRDSRLVCERQGRDGIHCFVGKK